MSKPVTKSRAIKRLCPRCKITSLHSNQTVCENCERREKIKLDPTRLPAGTPEPVNVAKVCACGSVIDVTWLKLEKRYECASCINRTLFG